MNHDTNHRPPGDDESQHDPTLEAAARLTAQALGESHDDASTTAGAGGRDALVDEIDRRELRRSGALVRQALADEPTPGASAELRQAVSARLDELEAARTVPVTASQPSKRRWLPLSLAASLLFVVGTLSYVGLSSIGTQGNVAFERAETSSQTTGKPAGAEFPSAYWLDDDVGYLVVKPDESFARNPSPPKQSNMQPWFEDKPSLGQPQTQAIPFDFSRSTPSTPPMLPLPSSPSSDITFSGGTLNTNPELNTYTGGTLAASTGLIVSGAGGLTKTGAGTLTFSGGVTGGTLPVDEGRVAPILSGNIMQGSGGVNLNNSSGTADFAYYGVDGISQLGASTPTGPKWRPLLDVANNGTFITDRADFTGGERLPRSGQFMAQPGITLSGGVLSLSTNANLGETTGTGVYTGGTTISAGTIAHLDPKASQAAKDQAGRQQLANLEHFEQTHRPDRPHNTEAYDPIVENAFLAVTDHPLSTFSIDVDTASYSNMRRFLNSGSLPPPGAVRIEELINYFTYDYPQPKTDDPFSVNTEVVACPWNAQHRLLRVGLKGREMPNDERPASNLVFLLDVSGSMDEPNKLPLVKEAMTMLVDQLGENDRVAIVVYAGASGLVLPSTTGDNKQAIRSALEQLKAGGSTNGASGLELAYKVAQSQFIKGGTNRVILATDGDFNVGVTNQDELVRLIEKRAADGVFFTALGFGFGNLKDSTLEKLADKGNGNYAYIDTRNEAQKVLVEELSGTLVTIAKDVKLQLEFNPARVAAFRLIGYENRILAHEDFNNDKKDAGDVGAGHAVTALYELVPAGVKGGEAKVDPLKYQRSTNLTGAADSNELLTLKLRYKQPDGQTSKLLEHAVTDSDKSYAQANIDTKFAASVAAFGMLLRKSPNAGNANLDAVLELAQEGLGKDPHGYRAEFIELVKKAKLYWPAKQ